MDMISTSGRRYLSCWRGTGPLRAAPSSLLLIRRGRIVRSAGQEGRSCRHGRRPGVAVTALGTRRQDGTVAQVVFALVLAIVVAVTLWWGFVRENAPLAPQGIRVEADFTAMRDGP